MNEQQQQQQQQQQSKVSSNFSHAPSNGMYTQEQYEAPNHATGNTPANNNNDTSLSGSAATVGNGNATSNTSNSPYMVLTQVAVPAGMMGQFDVNNPSQLLQLQQQIQRQQQQQQQGGNNGNDGNNASASSQGPQILSFNQLPPQIQQQVLLQQQQIQGQNQSSNASNTNDQQQQQQQLWKQMQQQQQPQKTKKLSVAQVQELMKHNQLDANLMKQLLANSPSTTPPPPPSNASNTNTNNDTSFAELFSAFQKENASHKDTFAGGSSSGNDTTKPLFLEAQVQPVQRDNTNDSCSNDDADLFKFFDTDFGDDSGPGQAAGAGETGNDLLQPNSIMNNNSSSNNIKKNQNFNFLEPTPMYQGQPQAPGTTTPGQVMSLPNGANDSHMQQHLQQQSQHQSASLQQQLQQLQQQLPPMAVPSQHHHQQQPVSSMAMPSVIPSQGSNMMGGQSVQSSVSAPSSMDDAQTFMLPSTMVPPTVLASVCTGKSRAKRSSASSKKKPASKKVKRMDTPQDVLMRLVQRQGHGELKRIKSEDAGYDTMPSPLQLSSFGTQVVRATQTEDVDMLGKLLQAGLSPNPCNQFRDSILDLVCKRNNVTIFNCLLEHGCDIRVVDGFGRTPLHHCGWASQFSREIAEAILERDPLQLFIEDKRGQTPLEYCRNDIMTDWSEFLEEMADKYWPKGGEIAKLSRPKDSRPDGTLQDPKHAVPAGLASMISAGNITTDQLERMDEATRKSYG